MLRHVGAVFSVFREAFRNPALRRVSGAYALFVTAEFGIWITLLVFAYDHGGASAITVMVLVQLLPCIVLAPVIGAFVDLRRPSGVLRVGYALQAMSMAGVAGAIGAGAPTVVVFVLAPLTAISLTMTRSPHAAVLPAVVRTPDEFTAANVMTGWADGLASLVGPAFAGVLLSVSGAGTAVAANAGMSMLALLMVVRVEGPAAARMAEVVDAPGRTEDRPIWISRAAAQVARQASALRTVTSANVVTALRVPQVRVLLALHTFYFVIIGTLDLMCVVLAVDTLHLGPGGAGYLNAALGGGALLALLVTAFLVGRRRLSNTLTSALVIAVVALALIGAVRRVVPVVLLICAVGLAGAVFDTTGRTLLQRSAPSDAIAGTYSILESPGPRRRPRCHPGSRRPRHRRRESGPARPRRVRRPPSRRSVAAAEEDRFFGDGTSGGDPALAVDPDLRGSPRPFHRGIGARARPRHGGGRHRRGPRRRNRRLTTQSPTGSWPLTLGATSEDSVTR